MKYLCIISLLVVIVFSAFSQDYPDPQNMNVSYNKEAEYPGGISLFISDLWNKMEYTQEAIDAKVDGEIMVSFDVKADSTVSGVIILSGLGYGIDEEFAKVLLSMKFAPASAEGNIINQNMIMNIPIRVGPKSKLKTD